MSDDRREYPAWPARAWVLLVLGAALGLIFYHLMDSVGRGSDKNVLPLAAASFVAVVGLTFAFTLERDRWLWTLYFAVACGLVMGGIIYWNSEAEGWRLASLLLSIGIAAPLFQVVRDEGRWNLGQRPIHAHAWTNAVLWCAGWAFVGLSFLLVLLLSQLFSLVGIEVLQRLLRKGWFDAMLAGAALGAVIGLLRDRDKVLGLLQRVVTIVLSVLTPFLAIGLAMFLLSLPFTGLAPLWRETVATTPILLTCALVAAIFVNATIGNGPDEEPKARVLIWSALLLLPTILPLAIVAAVSVGKRIGQYGFTPDRLWAATCILVALGYGVAYLTALVWGRARWPDRVRQLNVWLSLGICGLALVLATPLLDFGGMSTRDQIARLQDGRTKAEDFDWAAMAFDFGPAGRRAVERLKIAGDTPDIRAEAATALSAKSKWSMDSTQDRRRDKQMLASLKIVPKPVALPIALQEAVRKQYICSTDRPCTVYWPEGAWEALVFAEPSCIKALRTATGSQFGSCTTQPVVLRRSVNKWVKSSEMLTVADPILGLAPGKQIVKSWDEGDVTVKDITVRRRQIFVGDRPVSEPFE